MDTLFGLPAHPLLVHVPVVLLPLAAIGVVAMAIRPAWHDRYRWAVLAVGVVGTIGAILSAQAGENLEGSLRRAGETNTWEAHAEAGDTARTFAIIFVVLLAAYVLVPWWDQRRAASARSTPRWLVPLLAVLALAGAAGSVVTVVDAGHSGATSVWEADAG